MLPVWAQNLACGYYGRKEYRIRFSSSFFRLLPWLSESQWWSRQEIDAYKAEKLRPTMSYAWTHVPFYRQYWASIIGDMRVPETLSKLPILTKEDIASNPKALCSYEFQPSTLVHRQTSGTTGKSLSFYKHRDDIAFQWAIWFRHRSRFGHEFGEDHINFTGQAIVPIGQARPPYWRSVRSFNQHVIGMHHIVPDKISAIVEFLNSKSPRYWSGYPSIIAHTARLAQSLKLELLQKAKPKTVFLGAESVLESQRKAIESWTGAVVTDQYGLSEGCANASSCEFGNYHEDFEFCHLECIDPKPVAPGLSEGRIVATSLINRAMPFIRYDTGDIGQFYDDDFRCPCGRHSRAIKLVTGRIEDYVLTPEGNRVMRFDYVFKDMLTVKEAQVCQYKPGEIEIRIVPREGHGADEDGEIIRRIGELVSPRLIVRIKHCYGIERDDNGKFRAVKSFIS